MFDGLLHAVQGAGDLAGPYSNLLGVALPAWSFGALLAGLTARRMMRRSRAVLDTLQEDIRHRDETLARLDHRLKAAEARGAELVARTPEHALTLAAKETRDGNHGRAAYILADWIDREGEGVARVMAARAAWAAGHAAGERRAACLTVVEAYATASVLLAPSGPDGRAMRDLLGEVAVLRASEGQVVTALETALRGLAELGDHPPFDAEAVEEAIWTRAEAEVLRERGFANLALPLVERAERLFRRWLGPTAVQALNARILWGVILLDLGRSAEALPIAEAVAEEWAAHPDLGPGHPDMLASRRQVAELRQQLGLDDVESAISESPT
ncbi:tetratricopeptide repeat protein [Azospirillum argentinense]